MKNHLSARFLAALTVSSLFAAGQARADWSYFSAAVPTGFSANAVGGSSAGGGTIQLTPFGSSATPVAGASTFNILAYTVQSTAPVTFESANTAYQLTMTILGNNSASDSGTLTFHGSIAGGLNVSTSSLVNTFSDPTQSVLLPDGKTYTVTINGGNPVTMAPPGSQQNISATLSVSSGPGGPGGGGASTPEPASLVLGGLGFSLFGVGRLWHRLRRPRCFRRAKPSPQFGNR